MQRVSTPTHLSPAIVRMTTNTRKFQKNLMNLLCVVDQRLAETAKLTMTLHRSGPTGFVEFGSDGMMRAVGGRNDIIQRIF